MTPAVSIPLGGFNLSGGIKVLIVLANGMACRGWRVRFIVPDFARDSPFPLEPGVSVQSIRTGPAWLPLAWRQLLYYLRLMRIAAVDADVCLANYYPTSICATVSRLMTNRSAVVAYYVQGHEAVSHGLIAEANRVSRWTRYLVARVSYTLPVSFICVSRWVRDQIGRRDAMVAHAPVLDLAVFQPAPVARRRTRIVIGTIGRTGETKDYDLFLAAIAQLRGRSDLEVIVASPNRGEVPLPQGLVAEAVHATSEAAMVEFYRRCDVFVLTSRVEGFPLPPLEAMACGCAVVATRCGGITDYAQDGVNCLLVPPRDAQALAEALRTVADDATVRARLAAAGLETVRLFERDRMLSQFLTQFESLVHSQPDAA